MSGGLTNTSWRPIAQLTDWRGPIRKTAFAVVFALLSSLFAIAPTPGRAADFPSPALADASAVAHLGSLGRHGSLPISSLLTDSDIETYRLAFAAAQRGDAPGVNRSLQQIRDRRLVGHVRAELLLSPATKASFADLSQWLQEHADLPDAPAIYALATNRAPKGKVKSLRRPTTEALPGRSLITDLGPGMEAVAPAGRSDLQRKDAAARDGLKAQIHAAIRAAELDRAEGLVLTSASRHLLTEAEIDHYKTRIAAGLFARDDEKRALRLAAAAASRSGAVLPRSHWVAGLAAFGDSRFAEAAQHFESLARLPKASPWEAAAAAFWAGRAHLRARNFEQVTPWLEIAAQHPRSFYGMLAHRALGRTLPFNWDGPSVGLEELVAIRRTPNGMRGLMLLVVGQTSRAEAELARFAAGASGDMQRALFAIALRTNMVGLATRIGRGVLDSDGRRFEATNYPIPPWQPREGFSVDPALVYAFMRQESRFDARAVSPAGARGLMQLMPATAAIVNGGPVSPGQLLDPVLNVTLGDRYIHQLLQTETVGGDLIRLMASYNAGPQTVLKWKQRRDLREEDVRDDALLAIETLPSPETRHFITRVLYSYWMYSERMGQPTPSLDAVAEGRWPTYVAPTSLTARASPPNAKDR
ncbi:MAG: lytic transglycosylase domain-containing protein [Alphaproteobacteria bacterium]|nr:lytic transglycosylase domain-containing protein [Alphaproteobacteria bacterium]